MANALQDKLHDWYQVVKNTMGVTSSSTRHHQQQLQQQQHTSSITCDDCGRIFSVSADFNQTEKKKRCERCAARVTEEKVSQSPHARQCGGCQMIFNVSARVAEYPHGIAVNCQRCSDSRRQLIRNGTYVEVTLQKGADRFYVCCPKSLSSEMKKCMQAAYVEHNGYTMLPEN